MFCDDSEQWLFFPGRKKNIEAKNLCSAHGGWIVVPRKVFKACLILICSVSKNLYVFIFRFSPILSYKIKCFHV